MKQAIRDPQTLCRQLEIPLELGDTEAAKSFPIFAPASFIQRIQPGNSDDPLLRQILSLPEENDLVLNQGYQQDPLQEFSLVPAVSEAADHANSFKASLPDRQLIQKYKNRVLLITTGACGVHCRYCFRRHYPYQSLPQDRTDWQQWLDPIANDPSIMEVILSGGDPLVLNDVSLARLTDRLRQIPHVRWLRIHTRMPIVIPARVTSELTELLQGFAATTCVVHCNHANEIDVPVEHAIKRLKSAGIQVLNQAVLLRGVNDNVKAMTDLSLKLIECGVVPYYLHQLDKVHGAAHFHVPLSQGQAIMKSLHESLPGFAVPKYVKEIPGRGYKTLVEMPEDFDATQL